MLVAHVALDDLLKLYVVVLCVVVVVVVVRWGCCELRCHRCRHGCRWRCCVLLRLMIRFLHRCHLRVVRRVACLGMPAVLALAATAEPQ